MSSTPRGRAGPLRTACVWIAAGIVVLGVAGRIGPPWPATAAGPLALVFASAGLLLAAAWAPRLSDALRARLGTGLVLAGLAMTLAYGYAYACFVVSQPKLVGDSELQEPFREVTIRVVVGSQLRPSVPAELNPRELLLRYGFDPERIWTVQSLLRARVALASSFCLSVLTLALGGRLLTRGGAAATERLRVLHVWADPHLMPPTAAAVQVGAMRLALEPFAASIQYEDQPACSRQDLLRRLNWYRPHVLQISGHGDVEGRIALMHPNSGEPSALDKHELAALLRGRRELRLVVMDCCYGLVGVDALRGVVDAVIGVHGKIEEPYPILFSTALYDSIVTGTPLGSAVEYAAVAMAERGEEAEGSRFELWCPDARSRELRLVPDRPGA